MNTDDVNFAYQMRHALDAKLDDLRPSTTGRLACARQIALARKKPQALVAPNLLAANAANAGHLGDVGRAFSQPFSWIGRIGVALPLLALVAGLTGIDQFEQQQHIAALAELDVAVLSDALPLSAYLDHGFNAYLTQAGQ